jgi:membrane-associated phospholipid phosphatase
MGGGVQVIRRGPGRPLLGPSGRRWAGWLLVACAVVVAVLGALFANQTTADGFDRAVDSPVIALFGGHEGVLPRLAYPGTQIPAVVLSAVIVAACLLSGRLNGAVLAAVAVLAADGLDEGLLKPLVHRTYRGGLVYPSGHTTTVFALAATVTVLLVMSPQPAKARTVRALITAVAWVLGCVVAVAVIGMRWHYFTDTVAGAAVGIGTVCGLALILDLPAARRWLARASRQPSAEQERLSDPARAGAGRPS